jgi:hypothetical protein
MLARRATAWAATAISMLAAVLLVAPPRALAQATTTLLGVPVPDRVAGLPHEAPTDFETEHPGMGYGVRFPRPD